MHGPRPSCNARMPQAKPSSQSQLPSIRVASQLRRAANDCRLRRLNLLAFRIRDPSQDPIFRAPIRV